jgi:hypothetical protein
MLAVRICVPKAYASSFVTKFDESVNALPLRETVRYTEKNMKWTAGDFLVSQLTLFVDCGYLRSIELRRCSCKCTFGAWIPARRFYCCLASR